MAHLQCVVEIAGCVVGVMPRQLVTIGQLNNYCQPLSAVSHRISSQTDSGPVNWQFVHSLTLCFPQHFYLSSNHFTNNNNGVVRPLGCRCVSWEGYCRLVGCMTQPTCLGET
jgi:hypothetical protein